MQENWGNDREQAKAAWDKLSRIELEILPGDHDKLVGKLEDAYGLTRADAQREDVQREDVQREVETWQRSLSYEGVRGRLIQRLRPLQGAPTEIGF